MRALLSVAILVAVFATPVEAARERPRAITPVAPSAVEPPESVFSVTPSADGTALHVKGWFDVGSFMKFRRVAAANPKAYYVAFASAGGVIQEGALIGDAIRKLGLKTTTYTLCASACTLAFAGGRERFASPEAWLGFHRARWIAGPSGEQPSAGAASDTDLLQRASFQRAGIGDAFIQRALAVPADTIWFPDRATLVGTGVLTEDGGQWAYEEEAQAARWSARLRAHPLWAKASSAEPEIFTRIVALAWRLDSAGVDEASILADAEVQLTRAALPRVSAAPTILALPILTTLAAIDPAACVNSGWGMRLASNVQQPQLGRLLLAALSEPRGHPIPRAFAKKLLRKPISATARQFPGLKPSSDPERRCRASLHLLSKIAATGDAGQRRHHAFQAYAMLYGSGDLAAYGLPL